MPRFRVPLRSSRQTPNTTTELSRVLQLCLKKQSLVTKKCVLSLPKDHSWPILVAHATMNICISNIYDDISQKSSKGWDEANHSCTIVAYTPKKRAKIHCSCMRQGSCIPIANLVVAYDRISSSGWKCFMQVVICKCNLLLSKGSCVFYIEFNI